MERSSHSNKRHRPFQNSPGGKRVSSSSGVLSRSNQRRDNETNQDHISDDEDDDIVPLTKDEFENTIKMATNNKLNNSNTWDLNIIEYFYDMNQLRADDGVSINFQTASATLDGCTKVISKRVDSVGVDADALIQIMEINKAKVKEGPKKKRKSANSDDEDSDEDDNDDDEDYDEQKENKKNQTKSDEDSRDLHGTTLNRVTMADSHIHLDAVDPIFTRLKTESVTISASSLLMNSLRMTYSGFVTFDELSTAEPLFKDNLKSLDANKSIVKDEISDNKKEDDDNSIEVLDENYSTINDVKPKDEKETISLLESFKYIVDESNISNMDICYNLENIKKSINDLEFGKQFVTQMNEKIEKEDKEQTVNTSVPPQFDFDYDIDNFDMGEDFADGFNDENNNNHNNDYNLSEMTNLDTKNMNEEEPYSLYNGGDIDNNNANNNNDDYDDNDDNNHDVSMLDDETASKREAMFMAELDKISNRRNISTQYWKIRAINSKNKHSSISSVWKNNDEEDIQNTTPSNTSVITTVSKSKKPKKNEELIDFMSDNSQHEIELLFKKSKRSLPSLTPQIINVDETTIPDLEVWNSEKLVKSFLKPNRRLATLFTKKRLKTFDADQQFWALKYNDTTRNEIEKEKEMEEIGGEAVDFLYDAIDKKNESELGNEGNSNNDNYDDDYYDPGDYDFDAPIPENVKEEIPEDTQKIAWHKDNIHYEKRSKKINVRLLKQNLWDVTQRQVENILDEEKSEEHTHVDLKLSNIVKDTYKKYEGREKSELSTSFYFICMLHIANEEGLYISNTDDLQDLIIHT
ncbi:hypothetical protein C6P40_004448 [Pichia californica]|uniref:Condensin complex subunit 2 n=1 Tax=Pichia californica TaxID=460514 RepID=A0A9P6WQ38_9ASCO|nr:hypothetical protein C6P42_005325 [[Candida] californica]KAG0691197.1 hypothetical protein C6P40_004448 [[Candida] californica]